MNKKNVHIRARLDVWVSTVLQVNDKVTTEDDLDRDELERAALDALGDGKIIFAALEEFRTEVKDEH